MLLADLKNTVLRKIGRSHDFEKKIPKTFFIHFKIFTIKGFDQTS